MFSLFGNEFSHPPSLGALSTDLQGCNGSVNNAWVQYCHILQDLNILYCCSIIGCSNSCMIKYFEQQYSWLCNVKRFAQLVVHCSRQCNRLLLPVWPCNIKQNPLSITKIIFNAQTKPSSVLLSAEVSFRVLMTRNSPVEVLLKSQK